MAPETTTENATPPTASAPTTSLAETHPTETRVLGPADRPRLEQDLSRWTSSWGFPVTDEMRQDECEELPGYLDPSDAQKVMIGHFQGGQLIADMQLFFWNLFPHWTMESIRTYQPSHSYSLRAMAACYKQMFALAQQRDLKAYYAMIPAAWDRKYERYFARLVPEMAHWQKSIEAFVPAHTRPPYPYQWNIMERQTYACDLMIYRKSKIC